MGHAVLLTGYPGVGKTTIIRELVGQLQGCPGGFYTEEIREGRGRVGFRIVTLDGREAILAHAGIRGHPRVGKYGVDVKALERVGVKALREAIAHAEYVIVDEIGKMELFSSEFCAAVQEALDSPRPVIATIMRGNHPATDAIKSHPRATLIEVTRDNRDQLAPHILELIKSLIEPAAL